MRSISVPARPAVAAPLRMVWLPGAYHAAQDFLTAGFAATDVSALATQQRVQLTNAIADLRL